MKNTDGVLGLCPKDSSGKLDIRNATTSDDLTSDFVNPGSISIPEEF